VTSPRPYRIVDAVLSARTPLSPHMARLTFAGPDLRRVRTCAPDQRIKIFFPRSGGEWVAVNDRDDWYALYKASDPAVRPPMRTYTIRALRPQEGEMDVDFVLHGETGPASRWALNAQVGDPVQLTAPNVDYPGDPGGYEWKPPAGVADVLLIADETALPAAAGILEALARQLRSPRTQAYIEVPTHQDTLTLPTWHGLELNWLARDGAPHGALITAAAREALTPASLEMAGARGVLPDVDIETQLPWLRADPASNDFYVWVAGESAAVMDIRRYLIQDRGLDRRSLNLMGYWRLGRVLD
jgi:NADPH-dependent ferric siderophore reductase